MPGSSIFSHILKPLPPVDPLVGARLHAVTTVVIHRFTSRSQCPIGDNQKNYRVAIIGALESSQQTNKRAIAEQDLDAAHKRFKHMRPDNRSNGHAGAHVSSASKAVRTINRQEEETVRLIIQSLSDMGYEGAVQALSRESGVNVESVQVEDFKRAVLNGDWGFAESSLRQLELSDPKNKTQVLFLMREQKFLEQLEQNSSATALSTLRTELSPLKHNIDRLHFLSSLIMVASPEDLRSRANWSGVAGDSRSQLLRQLSSYISPNSMIPDARLVTLLESARQVQVEDCLYHTASEPTSFLIPDHRCPRSSFPFHTSHILQHSDEVWRVQYSPRGRYLATSGADGLALIYDTRSMRILHTLDRRSTDEVHMEQKDGSPKGIIYMDFNADETMLMTCSQDNVIVHWDLETGRLLNHISKAHDVVSISCASWLPGTDGGFISGGHDKKIHLYDDRGAIIYSWNTGRVSDLKVSDDGQYMVAITADTGVHVFAMTSRKEIFKLPLTFELTSLTLSKDSTRMLLSCSPLPNKSRSSTPKSQSMEVQERTIPDLHLIRRFEGQRQGQFVVRSTYAGHAEQFIMSGSEDSDVYLWHRKSGRLLDHIPGHKDIVSAVSWNPVATQWASASDDKTVRIWEVAREDESHFDDGSELARPLANHRYVVTSPEAYAWLLDT